MIYDTDGTILATWRKNDNATGGTEGIFSSQSTNDGVSYGTAAGVPNASGTDAAHIMGQLALDTTRNEVWMAYQNSANNGDIYLKRWAGSSNAWDAAGTRHVAVASTTNIETRPGIGYVAATNSLWVTWHRYADASNPSARLYYVRSNAGTLPIRRGVRPTSTRPASARQRSSRRWSLVMEWLLHHLRSVQRWLPGQQRLCAAGPATGGAPSTTYQLSATVDDPPLYARGNAGSPKLMWAQTTVNGTTVTGPTLIYSKNPPNNGGPDYMGNVGVGQTLYNLEENFDLWLVQVNQPGSHRRHPGRLQRRAAGRLRPADLGNQQRAEQPRLQPLPRDVASRA